MSYINFLQVTGGLISFLLLMSCLDEDFRPGSHSPMFGDVAIWSLVIWLVTLFYLLAS